MPAFRQTTTLALNIRVKADLAEKLADAADLLETSRNQLVIKCLERAIPLVVADAANRLTAAQQQS